jgi:hypothetical protein
MNSEVEYPPLRWATRAGLAANGLLHLMVGWFAARVALGGVERADQAGALQAIAARPFGRELVWLLVGGFVAVVMWRVREALWGFPYLESARQRTPKRLFSAVQAVIYTVLAVLAVRVAVGSPAGRGYEGLTAFVLRQPFGRPLVVAAGIGVLVTGGFIIVRGWQHAFAEDMDLRRASPRARAITLGVGRLGATTKGFAFMIIGGLVVQAALTSRPERAEGLDVALKTLAAQPYGPVLLIAVAIGLAGFGVFCFLDAHYHRV